MFEQIKPSEVIDHIKNGFDVLVCDFRNEKVCKSSSMKLGILISKLDSDHVVFFIKKGDE